jgi:hypothetical protein
VRDDIIIPVLSAEEKKDKAPVEPGGSGYAGNHAIIAAFCPPPTKKAKFRGLRKGAARLTGKREFFNAKINRLGPEIQVAKDYDAHVIPSVSRTKLTEGVEDINPKILVISGHHDQNKRRLVGFGEERGLDEISADALANTIIGSAVHGAVSHGGAPCELECVVLNTCESEEFAQALKDAASCTEGFASLVVVYWPRITADSVCTEFIRGFYRQFRRMEQLKAGWVSDCIRRGINNIQGWVGFYFRYFAIISR